MVQMLSGSETLMSIDQSVNQVRADMQALDQQIQSASDTLVRLNQDSGRLYGELAKLRVNEFTSDKVVQILDEGDRQVEEIMVVRRQQLEKLRQEIDHGRTQQAEMESQRVAQQQRIAEASSSLDKAEAATQLRLRSDPDHQLQLNKARQAEEIAKRAEAKTKQAQDDRTTKGKPFEADPLFLYLWERGYGTSAYSANPLTRFLDAWVARLCKYQNARPNYSMLLEIPTRLEEHAQRVRAEANKEFAALRGIEEAVASADGIPPLRDLLTKSQQLGDEIDAAIHRQEDRYRELMQQHAAFFAGEDEYSRKCVAVLVEQMQRDPLSELRREAEATPSAEDNLIVQRLSDIDREKEQLQEELTQYKQSHQRYLNRLTELEQLRRDFKQRRFDDVHSTFANGALLGAMLNDFLRGMTSSADLWKSIERNQRHRPIEADPTFGSGGFGFPGGSVWQLPVPSGDAGGSSYGSGRSGGGFRTGGGF